MKYSGNRLNPRGMNRLMNDIKQRRNFMGYRVTLVFRLWSCGLWSLV